MILLANSNVLIAGQSGSNSKSLNPNLMAVWRRFVTLRSLARSRRSRSRGCARRDGTGSQDLDIDPPVATSGLSYEGAGIVMAKTVADQFAETLAAAGVKRIYGIVGDSLNGLTDAIRRQGKIEWVHVRHEEGAAFAAGAEAHLSGELAVCAGSCGPGTLHLITGLFDAHRNRVPVLAIAAHIPSSEIGIDYFQATHPENLFKECSHYAEVVSHPDQLPQILLRAMRVAVGQRGVAVVVIPGNVALGPLAKPVPTWLLPAAPTVRPNDDELRRLAELLNGGSRITLFCGAGCAGAHDEVVELARKLKAPIVHALRGKEHIEYDNPFDVGMTG